MVPRRERELPKRVAWFCFMVWGTLEVAAMETKARELGVSKRLKYLFPQVRGAACVLAGMIAAIGSLSCNTPIREFISVSISVGRDRTQVP